MKQHAVIALVILVLTPAIPAQAQADGLVPGARVRVWPACPGSADSEAQACAPVVGRLLSIDTAGVLIQRAGMPADTLPLGSLARFEVSRGSRHYTLLGLGGGALVGLGAGMILASRAGCDHGIFGSNESEDDLCGAYGLVAIPAGAALGAVVGRLIRSERWQPIPTGRAALLFVPSRDRLSLAIRLAF